MSPGPTSGKHKIFCLLVVGLLLPVRPQGQPSPVTYYVSLSGDDRNPGTAEGPWRHMEWAMTRPFLRGGDTIRVHGGVYRPEVDSAPDDTLIRPVASGEPGRPIVVMAQPGETVILSGRLRAEAWEAASDRIYFHDYSLPSGYPFDHPFQVVEDGALLYRVSSLAAVDRPGRCFVDTENRRIYVTTTDGRPPSDHGMEYGVSASGIEFRGGVEHWRLTGFAVTGFRSTGILIANRAGRIELDQMDISYIGAHRPGSDLSNGYAIAVYDSPGGNVVRNNNLHHTLAEAVHVSQTGAGGDLYENNDIHDSGGPDWYYEGHNGRTLTGPGLILRGNRVTVRGNRFFANGYHGLILESDLRGSEGAASPSGNLVEGNSFALNAGNGIYGDGKNGLAAAVGNVIRFNLFDRNNQARGADGDAELRLAGNFDDTLVYNNTFYSQQANALLLRATRVADGASQGADAVPNRLRILNNICFHTSRQAYPLRAVDAPPDIVLNSNNWYRPLGGPLVSWNGTEFSSLEEFRGRTGQEMRGMSLDPRFVSMETGSFWLRAISPMIGRGSTESGAAPDLGAFPYRPLLVVSPGELRFVTLAGGRKAQAQTLDIQSAAGINLSWSARSGGEKWLRLADTTGETPGRVTISILPAGLAAGTYSGGVQIVPALEGEPPVTVRVTLTVLPAPSRRR